MVKKTSQVWLASIEGVVKFNFDGCSLGTLGQCGIGDLLRDHQGSVIKAYSKPVGDSFAINIKVIELLEPYISKALGLSSFVVEEDFATVIS